VSVAPCIALLKAEVERETAAAPYGALEAFGWIDQGFIHGRFRGMSGRNAEIAKPSTLGLQLHILHASTERNINTAFANLAQLQASGLVIGNDPFCTSWSEQIAALALRYAMPTIYENSPRRAD
jgi:hypothetical protein